jgi:hypothetical protein
MVAAVESAAATTSEVVGGLSAGAAALIALPIAGGAFLLTPPTVAGGDLTPGEIYQSQLNSEIGLLDPNGQNCAAQNALMVGPNALLGPPTHVRGTNARKNGIPAMGGVTTPGGPIYPPGMPPPMDGTGMPSEPPSGFRCNRVCWAIGAGIAGGAGYSIYHSGEGWSDGEERR